MNLRRRLEGSVESPGAPKWHQVVPWSPSDQPPCPQEVLKELLEVPKSTPPGAPPPRCPEGPEGVPLGTYKLLGRC